MADIPETAALPEDKTSSGGQLGALIKKFGTDALLIGALSALGYCVAFAYEAGYASHFGYPTYLITPTPNIIVTALASILIAFYGFLPSFAQAFDKDNSAARQHGREVAEVVVVLTIPGYVIVANNLKTEYMIGAAAFLGLYAVVRRLIFPDRAKSGWKADPLATKMWLAVIGAVTLYAIATIFGVSSAHSQRTFFFLKTKPDFAVVRLYDGLAIAVRYDAQKQAFVREYIAMKLGENKELDLVRTVLKEERLLVMKDE
jgi:hypothetical protein